MAGTSPFTLLLFYRLGFIICQIRRCSHYMGWRRKNMGSLDLNVVSCFGKSYFTQIGFAVWGEVKIRLYVRGRQRNKWQVEGVQLVDGSLEFCARARHSIGELQSDNLSRNWSWLRTHNNYYINESKTAGEVFILLTDRDMLIRPISTGKHWYLFRIKMQN